MKLQLKLISSVMSAMTLLAAGCASDAAFSDVPVAADQELELYINLEVSPMGDTSPYTRATQVPTSDECIIDDVLILVMSADGSQTLVKALTPSANQITLLSTGAIVNTRFAVPSAHKTDQQFLIAVVANGTSYKSQLTKEADGSSPDTYSTIRQKLTRDWSGDKPLAPESEGGLRFMFWDDTYINSKGKQTASMSLLRDLARIDVNVDPQSAAADKFVMTDVYIYRRSLASRAIPDADNSTISLPNSCLKADFENPTSDVWHYDVTEAGDASELIYIPEGSVCMRSDGIADAVGDEYHTERPALVVGGYYNESTEKSYYRVDFQTVDINADNSKILVDIVRNHLHKVLITDVKSPGEPTPDDAYKSISVKIEAGIINWIEEDNYIVWDTGKSHYISFSTRNPKANGSAGATTSVAFQTDTNPEDWELGWNSPDTASSLFDYEITYSQPDEENNPELWTGTILFTTKTAMNIGDPDRSATLKFSVENLAGSLTPTQTAHFGPGWDEGGDYIIEFD